MKRWVEMTLHERQMRFLTVMFVALGLIIFAGLFWLINHSLLLAP